LPILAFIFLSSCAKGISGCRGKSRADGKGNAEGREARGRPPESGVASMYDFVISVTAYAFLALLVLIPLAWLLDKVIEGLYGLCNILATIRNFITDITFTFRNRHRKPAAQTPQQPDSTFPTLPM
jgi:hypothetical protein